MKDQFLEFLGIDYSKIGYPKIQFRASISTITLESKFPSFSDLIKVPETLEVLTQDGWKNHAIVFYHTPFGFERNYHYLVFVMASGKMYNIEYSKNMIPNIVWPSESVKTALTSGIIGSY